MIVLLEADAPADAVQRVEETLRRAGGEPRRVWGAGRVGIEVSGVAPACVAALPGVAEVLDAPPAYTKADLAARGGARSTVRIGHVTLGGGAPLVLIAGPCAVESPAQIEQIAHACAACGVNILRGGAFKPRTSPYSFRGLGREGLKLLREAADRHGLAVVTEVMEPSAVDLVSEWADMLQVGSRNMQNFPLLAALGRVRKPVLLKRGMSATLEEWLLAAEYVLDGGNEAVVLCERGVRGFDPAARNLLDLAAVPLLRRRTHLPVVVDPSHGVGVRDAVAPMACAAAAAGADGVMVEVHPDPGVARSDGFQAITPAMLHALAARVRAVESALRATSG